MLQQCQEKNALEVEKSSTIFCASSPTQLENAKRSIADEVVLKIAEVKLNAQIQSTNVCYKKICQHSI